MEEGARASLPASHHAALVPPFTARYAILSPTSPASSEDVLYSYVIQDVSLIWGMFTEDN